MNRLQNAYADGMMRELMTTGVNERHAYGISKLAAAVKKAADYTQGYTPYQQFQNSPAYGAVQNMGDDMYEDNPLWEIGKYVLPIAALALVGYTGYRSGITGFPDKDAWTNFKNYTGNAFRNLTRKTVPRPAYDYTQHVQFAQQR